MSALPALYAYDATPIASSTVVVVDSTRVLCGILITAQDREGT